MPRRRSGAAPVRRGPSGVPATIRAPGDDPPGAVEPARRLQAFRQAPGPGRARGRAAGREPARRGRARRRRRRSVDRGRRGRRPGRRIRLRQVDPGPGGGRRPPAHGRNRRVPRAPGGADEPGGTRRLHPQGADDLPGPLRLPEPAPARGPDHRRGAGRARDLAAGRGRPPDRRGDAQGRPRARAEAPLPAPVLRWAAATHRHRPGAGGGPGVPGMRRGGRRPRRLHPGADPQPVHAPACRSGLDVPVHTATISGWSGTSPTGW